MTISSRFELLRRLGEGGMGVVHDAYDRVRNMRVALKTLRTLNASRLYALKREFRALRDLAHPNIITLYDLIADDNDCCISMEMVDGFDLLTYVRPDSQLAASTGSARLAEPGESGEPGGIAATEAALAFTEAPTWLHVGNRDQPVGMDTVFSGRTPVFAPIGSRPLPAELGAQDMSDTIPMPTTSVGDVVDLQKLRYCMTQLADALHAVHTAGLVHRDIKPPNVLVSQTGRVVLTDFGIAARASEDTLFGDSAGTPAYMAPEQLGGSTPSAEADWYAFGVLLFQALTGTLPFQGTGLGVLVAKQAEEPPLPSQLVCDVPRDLEELCKKLLARDPKARPKGTEVLEALGQKWHVKPAPQAPFIGRSQERRLLLETYDQVREGRTRCVIVEGESGIGKTALVDQVLAELRGRGEPVILSGRCHERETLAYKALDGVIDQLCVYLTSLDEKERRILIPGGIGLLARLFPVLRYIPEIDLAACRLPPSGSLPGVEIRSRAVVALRELLNGIARSRPVIVRIEDIQWAEPDSIALMEELFRPVAPQRLFIMLTRRVDHVRPDTAELIERAPADDFLLSLTKTDFCLRLLIRPLSDYEQNTLFDLLAKHYTIDARISDALLEEAKGHPLLLVELLRWAGEQAHSSLNPDSLSLDDIIRQRIERLSPAARSLIDAIAVADRPLPLDVLVQIAGISETRGERAAAMLLASNFARIVYMADVPWLDAYHTRLRDAALRRLIAGERAALHERAAIWLETWGKAPPAAIAHHWLYAGQVERAVEHWLRAAHHAYEQLAFTRASELYRHVIELTDAGESDPVLARARCEAWLGMAKSMRLRGEYGDALLHTLDQAEPLAVAHDMPVALATIYYLRGSVHFIRCNPEACKDAHSQAYAHAARAESPEWQARSLSGLGDAHALIGAVDEALGYYDRCIDECRAADLSGIEAANLPLRGTLRTFQMSYVTALDDFYRGIDLAQKTGSVRAEIVCRFGLSLALLPMDRLREVGEELASLEALVSQSEGILPLYAAVIRARFLLASGRPNESLRVAREGAYGGGGQARQNMAPLLLGLIALASADPAERTRALEDGERILAAGTTSLASLHFCADAMELGLVTGNRDVVERYAVMLIDQCRGTPFALARFLIDRAQVLSAWQSGEKTPTTWTQLTRLAEKARSAELWALGRALAGAIGG